MTNGYRPAFRYGDWSGLGMRSVFQLASTASSASTACSLVLTSGYKSCKIASLPMKTWVPHWITSYHCWWCPPCRQSKSVCLRRSWPHLLITWHYSLTTQYHRARLLAAAAAAAAAHCGDYLHAVPISACGPRMNEEIMWVHGCLSHVGLRMNDLVWRALSKAGFPSIKEPNGLLRSDNKRPDGLTLIQWRDGRGATWDVTVTDTLAPSYIPWHVVCLCSLSSWSGDQTQRWEIKLKSPATIISFPLYSICSILSISLVYGLHFCSEPSNFIQYWRHTWNITFIPTPFWCNPALQCSLLRPFIRQC